MPKTIFNKTLIIGLGLIGGSFAKACKKYNMSKQIYAFDLDLNSVDIAKESKIIDDLVLLNDDLENYDLIVLATPLSFYNEIIKKISPKISPNTIIIDLGSVKELEAKNKILPPNLRENFIPCHPIAGSEKSGFVNSEENLFLDKKIIICPQNCNSDSVTKIQSLFENIGSKVEFLDAKKHDEIYALVSHLPQFLSFLTAEFSPKEIADNFFENVFRLDNSEPQMWQDIFKINEKNLEKFYLKFFDNLEENVSSFNEKNFIKNKQYLLDDFQVATATIDEKIFEENFAAIFFRVIVVISYLEIEEIKKFINYAGSGFKDFTSIMAILNFDDIKINDLIIKNHKKITKIFSSIS